jgi:hypothetical protein
MMRNLQRQQQQVRVCKAAGDVWGYWGDRGGVSQEVWFG